MTRQSITVFFLRAVGMLSLFAMHTLVARAVGADGYGIFSFALSVAAIAGVIAPLGWPTALIRLIAQYRRHCDWGMIHGAMSAASITAIVGGLMLAVGVYLAALGFDEQRYVGLTYAAVLIPFSALVALRRKVLTAFSRPYQSVSIDEIVLPLVAVAICWLIAADSAEGALTAYVLALVITTGLSITLVRSVFRKEIPSASPRYQWRKWMGLAVPMAMGGISQMLVSRLDIVILGFLAPPEEVGVYAAAARFSSLIVFGLGAVAIVVPPILAAAYADGDLARFRKALAHGALLAGGVAVLTGVPLLVWPEFFLHLFNDEFVSGGSVLRVLAVGQIVSAAVGPVGFALLLSGGEKRFAIYQFCAALATVVADIVIFPVYGVFGVAVVTSCVVACVNVLGLVDVLFVTRDYRAF